MGTSYLIIPSKKSAKLQLNTCIFGRPRWEDCNAAPDSLARFEAWCNKKWRFAGLAAGRGKQKGSEGSGRQRSKLCSQPKWALWIRSAHTVTPLLEPWRISPYETTRPYGLSAKYYQKSCNWFRRLKTVASSVAATLQLYTSSTSSGS